MIKGKATASGKLILRKDLLEGIARKTPISTKEILQTILVLAILLAIVGWVVRFFMMASLGTIIYYAIMLTVVVLLVLLKRRYKLAEQVIEGAFHYNLLFGLWMIVTFAPIVFFFWLAPAIINRPTIVQVAAFVLWGLLLIFGSGAVLTEKNRERVLTWLQRRIGKFAPWPYALNLLFIAGLFFSSVTYVLLNHGVLRLDRPSVEVSADGSKQSPAEISDGNIKDFYAWHFVQGIPLLRINETLRWSEPLTYKEGWVGPVLLLFKLMVILPVIRVFTWSWRREDPRRKKLRRIRRLSSQPYY